MASDNPVPDILTQVEEIELPICPDCCSDASPYDSFCRECGRPLQALASFDPWKRVFLEGYVYRKAAYGSIRFGSLVLMWIAIVPLQLMGIYLLLDGPYAGDDGVVVEYSVEHDKTHTSDRVHVEHPSSKAWVTTEASETHAIVSVDSLHYQGDGVWITVEGESELPTAALPIRKTLNINTSDEEPVQVREDDGAAVVSIEMVSLGPLILPLLLLWRITSNYVRRRRTGADALDD